MPNQYPFFPPVPPSLAKALRLTAVTLAAACAAGAIAKLPLPSDEDKAKAAEAATKSAWSDKVGLYQLCNAQDRVAAAYRKDAAATGKTPAPAPAPTPVIPPCTDPGPYVSTVAVAAKPLEASGAHSPPGTATSPPGSNATQAQLAPKK